MIDLPIPTKHKLANLGVLSQKDRKPSEDPGAQLTLTATLPLAIAEIFFPGLLYLFELRQKAQGDLEAMSLEQLRAFTSQLGWSIWEKEHTGHKVTIDYGLGDISNPVITDSKLHSFRWRPVEGGIETKYKIDTPDISDPIFAALRKLKGCDISLMIAPPTIEEQKQRELDDEDVKPAKARKPGAAERAAVANAGGGAADATTIFAGGDASHEPPPQSLTHEAPGPDDGSDDGSEGGDADAKAAGGAPVVIQQSQPGTRTARGRDKTKAALAAGAH